MHSFTSRRPIPRPYHPNPTHCSVSVVEDVLTIVDPATFEKRFQITDSAVIDLRPHKHVWEEGRLTCTICHKTKLQLEKEVQ